MGKGAFGMEDGGGGKAGCFFRNHFPFRFRIGFMFSCHGPCFIRLIWLILSENPCLPFARYRIAMKFFTHGNKNGMSDACVARVSGLG
jgi:hypothetical protein